MGNGSEVTKISGRPETELERQIRLEMESGRGAKIRAENCMVEIKIALKKWNCIIDPVIQLSGRGITSNFMVVPNMEKPVA